MVQRYGYTIVKELVPEECYRCAIKDDGLQCVIIAGAVLSRLLLVGN